MNFAGPFDAKLIGDFATAQDGGFSFGPKPGFVQHHASDSHVVIPDDHLLFSGTYARIGNDLIITDANHKFVVGNYFKGDARVALTSATGATLSAQIVDALTGHTHYAQAAAPAAAAEVIGHVMKLTGSASVIRNGVAIELHIGDGIQKGDVIQTGSDSSIGMTFVDGTAFGMTSNARMVMNEMIYDPNGSSNSSLISLVQGTITFVAGQTAKNGNMRVETPVATMGIRGTAVLVEIAANDGPTKFSVLAEPDGHTGSFNLYDKVTGQLIGTVSQAGQVTFVSSLGIGQPPSAVEQLKTLQDQQNEKYIIQQVFQLFFPNYNPDNANPKGPKFGSSSTNNLAEIIIGTQTFGDNQVAIKQIELRFNSPDPVTGQNTQSVIFYNTKAIFSASSVFAEQSFSPAPDSFKIGDVIHINDPDIGTNPFNDVAVPFVPGSAVIVSATSTNPNLDTTFLTKFLHINQTTGEVTFDRLDFNFLGQGESVTYIVEVTSTSGPDSARVRIPITIYGDNDLPNGAPTIVTGPVTVVTGNVKEDTAFDANHKLTSNGTITFQDVDLIDTHTAAFVFVSSHSTAKLPGFTDNSQIGTFSLDPAVTEDTTDTDNTGTIGWHFSLSNNSAVVQSLAAGQTITLVYEVTIKDNHDADVTQTVTITITGTNDAPEILSAVTLGPAVVKEDSYWQQIASGLIVFKDVDLIDTHTASAQLVNAGGFAPGALGTFTFHTFENPHDVFDIGSVGWTFTLNDALAQQLAQGQTVTQTYLVTISDGQGGTATKPVTITIVGTNDAPVILSSTTFGPAIVKEDTFWQTASGKITFRDVDLTDTHTASVVLTNAGGFGPGTPLGTFTIHAHENPSDSSNIGSFDWTFTLNNSLAQQLGEGEFITQTYLVTISDGHGGTVTQPVTVTIAGTNDRPVLHDVVAGSLTDTSAPDTFANLTGQLSGSDVDVHDTLSYYVLNNYGVPANGFVTGQYGKLTVDADGCYIYVPNADAINALQAGQHKVDVFTVEIKDNHGGYDIATFKVDIYGDNDKPVIISSTSYGPAYVQEDSFWQTASGKITFKDAELTDTHTASVVLIDAGSFGPGTALGTFTFQANENPYDSSDAGSFNWTFTLNNARAQQLGEGESVVQTYLVTISDGHGGTVTQPITITIGGTNDKPVLHDVSAGSLTDTSAEDTFNNLVDQLNGSDVDVHDTLSYYVLNKYGVPVHGPVTGQYGTLTVNADGTYTYVPNADAINALQGGQHKIDTFTIETKDNHGGYDTATFKVDVYGADDKPVLDVSDIYTTQGYTNYGWTHTFAFHELAASDADGGSGVYTLKLTAHDGTLSLIDNHNGYNYNSGLSVSGSGSQSLTISGSLSNINAALTGWNDGFTYNTGSYENGVETIKAVLTNGSGPSDTVNFIFKQGGYGGATMTGSADKDVFFGNQGQDNFVFASHSGNDTIINFQTGSDHIVLNGYGTPFTDATFSTWLANQVTNTANGAVIHLDANDSITLSGVTKANLTAHDFILHPGAVGA